jgi:hypothetical protein
MGDSADEAIGRALTILREYVALYARDGMTFEQARRPAKLPVLVSIVWMIARAWIRSRRRPVQHRRLPLNPAIGH